MMMMRMTMTMVNIQIRSQLICSLVQVCKTVMLQNRHTYIHRHIDKLVVIVGLAVQMFYYIFLLTHCNL